MNHKQIEISNHWPEASRKRKAVAIYVDFLIFSALIMLISWFVGKFYLELTDIPFWLEIIIFAVTELILFNTISWSPGYWALGIHPSKDLNGAITILVEPELKSTERWWTMLLGVLIVLEGTKTAVRWALWHPPIPFMGTQLDTASSAFVSIIMGGLLCAIGLFLLRCSFKAAVIGLIIYGIALISSILSYELLSSWAAADFVARREYQDLPVREGGMQAMQQWVPIVMVVTSSLMCLWLTITIRRFRSVNISV